MRDSKAEEGESGSWGLGVLDLKGLPANAWEIRLMDMVVREENMILFVRVRVVERKRTFFLDQNRIPHRSSQFFFLTKELGVKTCRV